MKEKLIKYKWLLVTIGIIIFNIGWQFYDKMKLQEGVIIEEVAEHGKNADEIQNLSIIDEEIEVNTSEIEAVSNKQEVPIYICGEVKNPGVYYVLEDAIINEVIEICGGFTEEADTTAVNLASPIIPNEKIIIPNQTQKIDKLNNSYENRERIETLPSSQLDSQSSKMISSMDEDGLININTATKEQLMTLKGIGEAKAEAIIVYRQENGGFQSIDEMVQVSGIGEKTFEKLKQFITT